MDNLVTICDNYTIINSPGIIKVSQPVGIDNRGENVLLNITQISKALTITPTVHIVPIVQHKIATHIP